MQNLMYILLYKPKDRGDKRQGKWGKVQQAMSFGWKYICSIRSGKRSVSTKHYPASHAKGNAKVVIVSYRWIRSGIVQGSISSNASPRLLGTLSLQRTWSHGHCSRMSRRSLVVWLSKELVIAKLGLWCSGATSAMRLLGFSVRHVNPSATSLLSSLPPTWIRLAKVQTIMFSHYSIHTLFRACGLVPSFRLLYQWDAVGLA